MDLKKKKEEIQKQIEQHVEIYNNMQNSLKKIYEQILKLQGQLNLLNELENENNNNIRQG